MRACIVPKSWQCWWEGPLWFSHPASHWNQVGPSGCVPCYFHKIKVLKDMQVNLYGHNHTCAVGTGTSATPLLTTVQPGGWTRVCCISFLGWVSLQGKPVWVRVSGEHKSSHYPEKYWGMQRDQDLSAHYEELFCPTQQLQFHPEENRWIPRDSSSLPFLTRTGPPSVRYQHIPDTILSSKLREIPLLPGWQTEETSA